MATQRDIADHVGITQPAVAELVRAGVIEKAARGGYDMVAARLAYCAHLREQAAGRAGQPGAALDLATERARLAAAHAEAQERKNAHERGQLVDRTSIDLAMTTTIQLSVSRLQLVGARVARGDAQLRKRIDAAVTEALEELAETSLAAILAAGGIEEEGAEDGRPPA